MKYQSNIFIVAFIFLVSSLAFTTWAKTPDSVAKLVFFDGKVQVQRDQSKALLGAKLDLPLFVGDSVFTKEKARAEIEFNIGDVVRLSELSRLRVNAVRGKQSFQKKTILHLLNGEVMSRVENLKGSNQQYTIETAVAFAAVKGTIYSVSYDEATQVFEVKVLEGEVEVTGKQGKPVVVPANQSTTVIKSAPPVAPHVMTEKERIPLQEWKQSTEVRFVPVNPTANKSVTTNTVTANPVSTPSQVVRGSVPSSNLISTLNVITKKQSAKPTVNEIIATQNANESKQVATVEISLVNTLNIVERAPVAEPIQIVEPVVASEPPVIRSILVNNQNSERLSGGALTLQKDDLLNGKIVISGEAYAENNSLQRVEVSLDGGRRWFSAEGTVRWSYVFSPVNDASYEITVRAFNKSGVRSESGFSNALSLTYQKTSNKELITQSLGNLIRSYNIEDTQGFLAEVADNFFKGKDTLQNNLESAFSVWDNIKLSISNLVIDIVSSSQANAQFRWAKSYQEYGIANSTSGSLQMTFKKDSDWKIVSYSGDELFILPSDFEFGAPTPPNPPAFKR